MLKKVKVEVAVRRMERATSRRSKDNLVYQVERTLVSLGRRLFARDSSIVNDTRSLQHLQPLVKLAATFGLENRTIRQHSLLSDLNSRPQSGASSGYPSDTTS